MVAPMRALDVFWGLRVPVMSFLLRGAIRSRERALVPMTAEALSQGEHGNVLVELDARRSRSSAG